MSQMFNMFGGAQVPVQQGPLSFAQKMNMVRQAMGNPMMIVKQKFTDIPDSMMNDPNQIFDYLQRTRGIPMQDVRQLMGMFGGMR
jgi:hypothetical protein